LTEGGVTPKELNKKKFPPRKAGGEESRQRREWKSLQKFSASEAHTE